MKIGDRVRHKYQKLKGKITMIKHEFTYPYYVKWDKITNDWNHVYNGEELILVEEVIVPIMNVDDLFGEIEL